MENPYLSEAISQIGGGVTGQSLATPMQDFPPTPQFGPMVGAAPTTNIPVQIDLDPIDPLEILESKLEAKINRGRNTQAAARAVTDIRGTKPIMEHQKILADRAAAIEAEVRRLQSQLMPPPQAQPIQINDRQMLFAVLGELLTGGSGHALSATLGQSKERQERDFANAMRQYGFDQSQIQQGLDRYRQRLMQVEGQSDQLTMMGVQDEIGDQNRADEQADRVNLWERGAAREDAKDARDKQFTLDRDKGAADLQRERWKNEDDQKAQERKDKRRTEAVTTYNAFLDQAKETIGAKGFTPEVVAMLNSQRRLLATKAGVDEKEVGYLPQPGDTLETLEFGLRRDTVLENIRRGKESDKREERALDQADERIKIDRDRLSNTNVKPDEAEKDTMDYVEKVWTPGRGKVLGAQASVEQIGKQIQSMGSKYDSKTSGGLDKASWNKKRLDLEEKLAKAESDLAAARAEFGPTDQLKTLYTDRAKMAKSRGAGKPYPDDQMEVAIRAKREGHSVEKIKQAAASKGFTLTEAQLQRLVNAK